MKFWLRIGVYVVLLSLACIFAFQTKRNYDRLMTEQATQEKDSGERVPAQAGAAVVEPDLGRLVKYGLVFVLSAAGLGLLVAHDVARYFGHRAVKALYNDEGEGMKVPEYELAEERWADGDFLQAIQILRDYLKTNPREQHAALRIAEIYEKDLQNYLAAALEYEEVLKTNLEPERWGWAAIHLVNIYSGRLNQPDKALALLRRIVGEYGQTAAAKKARERLAQLEGTSTAESGQADFITEEPTGETPKLPPGFLPKKT
jgi:TolA-binding protein